MIGRPRHGLSLVRHPLMHLMPGSRDEARERMDAYLERATEGVG